MTNLGKTIFGIGMAGLLAAVWFAVRSDGESPPAPAPQVHTAQVPPAQPMATPPAPAKVEAPVQREKPPPDEDPPEDGNGS